MDINKAIATIQNFLDNGSNEIYVIDSNGNTFTLEKGCLLLDVDNSHMQTLEVEVR